MFKGECRICGTPFETTSPKKCTCSPECSKIYEKRRHKMYRETPEAKALMRKRYLENYKPRIRYCRICGEKLPDGRQKFCLRCLLHEYIYGNYRLAYKRLVLRGYDGDSIRREISRLGL